MLADLDNESYANLGITAACWYHSSQLAKISVITSKCQINHKHASKQVIHIGTKSSRKKGFS